MHGTIRRRDIIAHPVTTIRCFGWEVFLRSLVAGRNRTFLSIVGQATVAPKIVAELQELIERGMRLELRAMRLYEALAARFAGTEPVREFFAGLARQEESHAELLELCRASCSQQAGKVGRLGPSGEVMGRLEEAMGGFERRVEQIGGVVDALQLVIDVESCEINDVFAAIVDTSRSRFVHAMKVFKLAQRDHLALICHSIATLTPDLAAAAWALREKYQ